MPYTVIINAQCAVENLKSIEECQEAYGDWQSRNGHPGASEMRADSAVLKDGAEIGFISYNGRYWDWNYSEPGNIHMSNALTRKTPSASSYAFFKKNNPQYFS